MGTEIISEQFDARDYARFRGRLEQNLSELRRLLERPGFGVGPLTIGAELELFLVDAAAQACDGSVRALSRSGSQARIHSS